jgi:hypothetical protein
MPRPRGQSVQRETLETQHAAKGVNNSSTVFIASIVCKHMQDCTCKCLRVAAASNINLCDRRCWAQKTALCASEIYSRATRGRSNLCPLNSKAPRAVINPKQSLCSPPNEGSAAQTFE